MKKIAFKIQFMVALLTAATALSAEDNYSSKLNNKSKQGGNEGYYLMKDNVWGDNDCVVEQGKERINPGEDSTLTIKKVCRWGGIRYKIFTVTGDNNIGYLGHSFHDGNFSIDITAPCNGTECNFVDLNPTQSRTK